MRSVVKEARELAEVIGADDFDEVDYALTLRGACQYEMEEFQAAAQTYARLVDDYPDSEYSAAALRGNAGSMGPAGQLAPQGPASGAPSGDAGRSIARAAA